MSTSCSPSGAASGHMEHGHPDASGTRSLGRRSALIESIDDHRRARRGAGSPLATVEEAIEEFRAGRSVIIVDDEDRENEGDLCIPGQFVTPESIAFMLQHTSGVICVPMTGERLDALGVPMMVGQHLK